MLFAAFVVATFPYNQETGIPDKEEFREVEEQKFGATEPAKPQLTIRSKLEDKDGIERASIKGQEIAKNGPIARTHRTGKYGTYDIEITSINPIEKGVEVFARAWDENGEQIGFGSDGTVDIERFNIYNPPVLVDDPDGDIVQEYTDSSGVSHVRKLREDTKEALLQSLEHTLSVKKQKFGPEKISAGKIGSTTSTFYPDANPETTSVDARVRNLGSATFSTVRDAATGDFASDSETGSEIIGCEYQVANGYIINRGIFLFDSSALGDSDTVDSATFSLYVTSTSNTDNDGDDYESVVTSSPASNTAVTTADFDQLSTTEQHDSGQRKDITGISTGAYLDWTLNATGIGNVSKTSVSKFGVREGHDITNSAIPAVENNGNRISVYFADQTGTTNDPKLVVESTAAAAAVDASYIINFE